MCRRLSLMCVSQTDDGVIVGGGAMALVSVLLVIAFGFVNRANALDSEAVRPFSLPFSPCCAHAAAH